MSNSFESALQRLRKSLPEGEVLLDAESRARYAGDKWFAANTPDAVALPSSTRSVSVLLKFASKNKIPVTARVRGSDTWAVAFRREGASSSRWSG
jgi:FAD/FMN-containing dehydrogenase